MNLKDARENYYFHTGKVSDIVRQLGLGAIAVVWLFHSGSGSEFSIPAPLILPLKLVVAGLALDLLQYASGSFVWGLFQWWKARNGVPESDVFKAPSAINLPALLFFWGKVVLVVCCYWNLWKYLSGFISAGV
jgi:hypothetical protein